ncbi:hypothetical protein HYP06_gp074 [Vibrio phage vB_VspP_pVa5]|uniref:Uncharacterized protein n=1 Tax=Vibrio phage vB_VspP_pVa5 TaxID=1913109 RepID=A0A1J0GV96_9CAUD|nr:hypothetical protein HYP06_gp074 [Vibrio phage vB_VspP_pVa5]APC46100.1 hypothetical protein vBVspPpVa5_0099 [Vibrio phage vB_VspP_pVa5]
MYSIYIDRDDDIWLQHGNKIHAYESVDATLQKNPEFFRSEDRNVEDIISRWDLRLVTEGTNLQTVAAEAKLELLLR